MLVAAVCWLGGCSPGSPPDAGIAAGGAASTVPGPAADPPATVTATTDAAATTDRVPVTTEAPALADPSLPADLAALVDRSVMEAEVARSVFDRIGEVIGDPQGRQRIDPGFVEVGLTRVLASGQATSAYFADARLPQPAHDDSLVIDWLMCSAAMGEVCGGSVGNVVADLLLCANTDERRWAAAWAEAGGRFAAGVYCEYRPPSAQTERLAAGADRCVAAVLRRAGLEPRRVDYLDSVAAEFAVIPGDTPQEEMAKLLTAHSATFGGRYVEQNVRPDEAFDSSCTANISGLTANLDNAGRDGEYGVAVVARERHYRVALALG